MISLYELVLIPWQWILWHPSTFLLFLLTFIQNHKLQFALILFSRKLHYAACLLASLEVQTLSYHMGFSIFMISLWILARHFNTKHTVFNNHNAEKFHYRVISIPSYMSHASVWLHFQYLLKENSYKSRSTIIKIRIKMTRKELF